MQYEKSPYDIIFVHCLHILQVRNNNDNNDIFQSTLYFYLALIKRSIINAD